MLLDALLGRIVDRAPAVRARAAGALAELLHTVASAVHDESNEEPENAMVELRKALAVSGFALLNSLRKRALSDEKSTVRKACTDALVQLVLLGNSDESFPFGIGEEEVCAFGKICQDHSMLTRRTAAQALTFLLETSAGDTKTIQPGQAILLEDVLVKGHKIRPMNHHDVRVLFLTLPNTHYRTGKDHISIPTTIIKPTSSDPCPLPEQMQELTTTVVQRDTQIRRVFFGLVGLSLSTILADFLGKTAPLWLAVGVGGTFFVVGGTIGTIALGEAAVSNFQAWMLSRRLSVSKDDTPSL